MHFISLRKKLNSLTTMILVYSIGTFFILVTLLGLVTVQRNQKASEENVQNSLLSKGKILITNNTPALRTMAQDYSFLSIGELVRANVRNDDDIIYGIYMDDKRQPWVMAGIEHYPAVHDHKKFLDDSLSLWANNLALSAHKTVQGRTGNIIEFAGPIFSDDIRLGTIRYGISTEAMKISLDEIRRSFYFNTSVLFSLLIIAGLIIYFSVLRIGRRNANSIVAPIDDVTAAANAISNGNYEEPVSTSTNDEIGTLSRSFEMMRVTIKNYTQNLEHMVEERTAQLQQAQNELLRKNTELEKTNARLLEIENMKTLLTNTLVHDIKNLIFTMAGDIQILKKKNTSKLSEKSRVKMSKVSASCSEVFRLTSNILDVNRLEEGKLILQKEPLDFHFFYGMLMNIADYSAIRDWNIVLDIEYPSEPFIVDADKHVIERVFQNLMSNAEKYGKKGSHITVTFHPENDLPQIWFANSGEPIPEERHESIFEKFSQVDKSNSQYSKGLGLFFCKTVMNAHGGRIWVESDENGNCFKLAFPPFYPKVSDDTAENDTFSDFTSLPKPIYLKETKRIQENEMVLK